MPKTATAALIRSFVERLEARDWVGVADLLADGVVYRLPQTGEQVRGREEYLRFNREYPDGWHLRLVEAYGDESGGAARLDVSLDGKPGTVAALVFVRTGGGRLTEITDYWPEPYDPPPGREHLVRREVS